MAGRVVVVGLGPAGAEYLLPAARAAIAAAPAQARFVRTARHPAVEQLAAEGLTFVAFDDVYDGSSDLEATYEEITARVLRAARDEGTVVYAVPGSPAVAERTVVRLHAAAASGVVELDVVAGLSFAEVAWARLGIDPMATGARVVDGRAIVDAELAGPLLIAQCDNRFVLSDVKVELLEHLAPSTTVTVVQRLGLADEQLTAVALEELDRVVEPDHLTAVYVDAGAGASTAARELVRLFQLAKRLRDPGGCAWDAEQTHHSLSRYLLEESYEVVEAIDALPIAAPGGDEPGTAAAYAALADELGDLLYEVVFHAVLAEEVDGFTMADVARGIHDKLVRRHPHVFGEVVADDADVVVRNWEQIKLAEKGTTSLVEGITPGLPSLLYTNKLFRKAASLGLDPGDAREALDRIDAAVASVRTGERTADDALAQLLAAAVVLARASGVDAESALRHWAARYRERFEAMERLAAARGVDLATSDRATVAALWLEAGVG
jgi:tetrapyrrole methylase family protein/MazG family protein